MVSFCVKNVNVLILGTQTLFTKNIFDFSWNTQLCVIFTHMSSYWWIGLQQLYQTSTKSTNNTLCTRNLTVLWWLLWDQVTLYNSNIFRISVSVSEQSFPNYVLKIFGFFFECGFYYSKLLKMSQNYYESLLKVHELKVWVK